MKFARQFSQSFLGQKVSKKTSVHPDQVWLYAKSAGSAQMMMLPLSLQYWRIRLYDVQVRRPSHRSTYFSPFLSSPIHSSLHSAIFGYASLKLWNASFSHHSRICNLHGDVWIFCTKVSCRNLFASSVEANSKESMQTSLGKVLSQGRMNNPSFWISSSGVFRARAILYSAATTSAVVGGLWWL